MAVRTSLPTFKMVSLTQQSSAIKGCIKKGTRIGFETRERRYITRYTLDLHNAKIARYALDPKAVGFIFYNRIDENTTETLNFITAINQNGLETNQMILRPTVSVEVVRFLSKS